MRAHLCLSHLKEYCDSAGDEEGADSKEDGNESERP
mgnify:CR=1 FL=1